MQLTDFDRALRSGESGEAARIAMELLVSVGEAEGAPGLVDIVGAHVDACLYHGRAGLDFAKTLVDGGGEVRVPTTLNVSSLDLLHPSLYRGPVETAVLARELMDSYVAMGCTQSWTCAPYQLAVRPALGDQIAWGESNAIVFANSVLGARTGRYGDFLDISCALTGRAPFVGLHTDSGRVAKLILEVGVPDHLLSDELFYPILGHVLGQEAGNEVAVIVGLDERATEDRLKALGAAAASSGSVAMFHAVGVTPEAPTLDAACGGDLDQPRLSVGLDELSSARRSLGHHSGETLGAVSVGTPHFSKAELMELADLVGDGSHTKVPFYVSTGRDVLESVASTVRAKIEQFGAQLVTDTCTYITPIMGEVEGVVLTNSGKWAFYAPGNLGVEVQVANLADCVQSAVDGGVTGSEW
ncbi:MAG: aconitase X catalytic domain-containing protein [Acidimicrobiia bacterium]